MPSMACMFGNRDRILEFTQFLCREDECGATQMLTPALRAGPPSGTFRAALFRKQTYSQYDDIGRCKGCFVRCDSAGDQRTQAFMRF